MKHRALIVAHRGVTVNGANNTLAAFERAIELGADMVEFDVRRTQDALVVFHDDEAGGIPVSKLTHAGLRKLSGVDVPTFTDVLELLRGRMPADIELKETGYEEEIIAMVSEHGDLAGSVFTSFLDKAVLRMKHLAPEARTGLILGRSRPVPLRVRLSELRPLPRLRACRADYAVVNLRLVPFVAGQLRKADIGLMVWTVNQPADLRRYLHDPHIAGVATDNTPLALELAK